MLKSDSELSNSSSYPSVSSDAIEGAADVGTGHQHITHSLCLSCGA